MNDRHIAMLFLAVLIMGLAISTFGQSGPAWYSEQAGGPDWYRDNALRHDWYKDLKTKSGWSCCSGDEERGDCRPAQARQRDDGLWDILCRQLAHHPIRRDPARRVEQGPAARTHLRARGIRLLLPERRGRDVMGSDIEARKE
jgi:hypothetical protein